MRVQVVSLEELAMKGEEIADPRVDVEADNLQNYEMQQLWRHVKKLPPLERGVICWRAGLEGESLNVRQVAKRMRVSVATAWKIEQRGMEMLRDYYLHEALAA